jgi:hypothetical protein
MVRHASLRCPLRPRLSVDQARSFPLQLSLLLAIGCVGPLDPADDEQPSHPDALGEDTAVVCDRDGCG